MKKHGTGDIPLPKSPPRTASFLPPPPPLAPFMPPTHLAFPNYFLPPPPLPVNYPVFTNNLYQRPPIRQPAVNVYRQPSFNFNSFNEQRNELLERFKELTNRENETTGADSQELTVEKRRKTKINITFYRENTQKLEDILCEIKTNFEILKNDGENMEIKKRIDELRKQYEEIYGILNDEKNKKVLRKQVNKQKSKRKRTYRNRMKRRLDEVLRQNAIEQKHAEIDNNLKLLTEKIKQEKEKEESKKIVDETLHQVRKRLTDTKVMIEFCSTLRKLRQIRRQHARDKNTFPKDDDPNEEAFDSSMKEIETVLLNQNAIYENERANLILKLDLEKEKRKKRENELNKEKFEIELKQYEKQIKEILFGKSDEAQNDNNLMKQFHSQSETSLDSLLFIRHQWDQYMVPKGTPGASSIPLEWVYPTEASDSNWAKYLNVI